MAASHRGFQVQSRLPRLLFVTVVVLVMAVAAVVTAYSSLSAARGAPAASVQVHVPLGTGSETKPAEGSDGQTSDCRSAVVGLTC